MTETEQKDEKYFLEIIASVLADSGLGTKEEAINQLEETAYQLSNEGVELKDIPEIVAYLHKAGCIPGDIIRAQKLGYCKRLIEAYKKIIKEIYKHTDALELFIDCCEYIHLKDPTIPQIKRVRKP